MVDGTVEVAVPVVEMAAVELDPTDRTQVDGTVTVRALLVGVLPLPASNSGMFGARHSLTVTRTAAH